VVSSTFYKGRLKVAKACLESLEWRRHRRMPCTPDFRHHLYLEHVPEEWKWSPAYGGPIRHPSAVQITDRIADLLPHIEAKDMLVLTPFRAQRSLIKGMLRHLADDLGKPDLKKVKVSTVHRAQGMECHTIFFDPVSGDSEWLKSPEMACLINVALSRAQARLVVHLSDGDRRNNPLLSRLASAMKASLSIEEAQERAAPKTGGILIKKASQLPTSTHQAGSVALNRTQAVAQVSDLLLQLAEHFGPDNTHKLRGALGVSFRQMREWLESPESIPEAEWPHIQKAHAFQLSKTNRSLESTS
jgi:hypothetical protein